MKIKILLSLLIAALTLVTCKQYQELTPSRSRQLQPGDVSSYHPPVRLNVGWVPYQENKLIKTKDHEWTVVRNKEGKQGSSPVILLTYPDTQDTVWLDMNMDNELLGKLLKHSLMTQEPITRPYSEYFELASCTRCHPSDVKVDFD